MKRIEIDGSKDDDYIAIDFETTFNFEVFGYAGNDTLIGGAGNDLLRGGNGHDTLKGGRGNDILKAGRGDDTVYGGFGHDTLYGGKGRDNFVFNLFDQGADTIKDFTPGEDVIRISFFGNGDQPLTKNSFHVGQDDPGDAVVIYHKKDGELFFNIDGEEFMFAKVEAGLKLHASDFVI